MRARAIGSDSPVAHGIEQKKVKERQVNADASGPMKDDDLQVHITRHPHQLAHTITNTRAISPTQLFGRKAVEIAGMSISEPALSEDARSHSTQDMFCQFEQFLVHC